MGIDEYLSPDAYAERQIYKLRLAQSGIVLKSPPNNTKYWSWNIAKNQFTNTQAGNQRIADLNK